MTGTERRRSWWGWGWEDEALSDEQARRLAAAMSARFSTELTVADPPRVTDLDLRAPRVAPPAALAPRCSTDPRERAAHTLGKAYRDIVRGFQGRLDHPPDVVAHPRSERDVVDLLDWCAGAGVAAIPYGGGSSVVGGVEGDVGDAYAGVVSIDLAPASNLAAGVSLPFQAHVNTSAGPGSYQSVYTINVSDEDIPGATALGSITVTVQVTIAPACAGDVNGDGMTNSADFNIIAGNFGGGPGLTRAQGDLTGDGFVNSADFNVLAGDFGCQ